MATGVADAVTERELNGIVRDGIKNPFIWINIAFHLYKDNDNAPWRDTFAAVSTALTSFRQKGFDPYVEAKTGPIIGSNVVSANSANAFSPNQGQFNKKRSADYPRDNSGRFQKQARGFSSPSPSASASGGNVNSNFNPLQPPLQLRDYPVDAQDAGSLIRILSKFAWKPDVLADIPCKLVKLFASIMIIMYLT